MLKLRLMHSKLHNLNIADAKLHQRHLLTACRNYRTLIYTCRKSNSLCEQFFFVFCTGLKLRVTPGAGGGYRGEHCCLAVMKQLFPQ